MLGIFLAILEISACLGKLYIYIYIYIISSQKIGHSEKSQELKFFSDSRVLLKFDTEPKLATVLVKVYTSWS
jgi:hypothetical protein